MALKKLIAKVAGTRAGRTARAVQRRGPRVGLPSLQNVNFLIDPDGARIELANISVGGIGMLRKSAPVGLSAGQRVEGTLVCGESRAPASLEIIHVSGSVVGCKFVGEIAEASLLVSRTLDLELTALGMTAVRPEMLQEESEGTPHWIHGANGCEIFVVSRGDELVRYHLAFFGNYIEGQRGKPFRCGQVVMDETRDKPSHEGSALIRWDPELEAEIRPFALRFLSTAPHLSEPLRRALLDAVRDRRG